MHNFTDTEHWPAGARTLALKQAYPGNLMTALAIASVTHFALAGALILFGVLESSPVATETPGPRGEEPDGTVIIKPPVSMSHNWTTNPGRPAPPTPEIGIPVAVPDHEVITDPDFPTRFDLAERNAGTFDPVGPGGGGGGEGGGGLLGGTLSPVAVDEPVPLHLVQELPVTIGGDKPAYPEYAALLGKIATVWIRARIDATGKVTEAEVYKSTDHTSGFNESALDAAYTRTYRPAIQNGRPVSVWIVYRVEFTGAR